MLYVIEEGPGRPASNREGILRSGPIGKSPRWSSLTGKGPERWARVMGGKVPLGRVPKDQASIGRVSGSCAPSRRVPRDWISSGRSDPIGD